MADDSAADRPEPASVPQQRALTGEERGVLHRVIGMVEGQPGYAGTTGPALRAAIGDGTRPQHRELTDPERARLGNLIRRLIEEWDGPRLFTEPTPAWSLSGADIARLGLIWRAVSPPPDDPERPLAVNAADWEPPAGIPDDWVVANAPRPIRGPASARAWQDEGRHGAFYAAWPIDDDDNAYWEDSGAREVLVLTGEDIAAEAGRYLAACGLLPGEAGLTAADVASRLGLPWKEGILDDDQAQAAALAAVLGLPPREDEHVAYDDSGGPQRRALTDSERAFLSRLIGQAAADPRFAGAELIRRPVIRAVLGDGTRAQARPLTARERDDIGWLVNHVRSEWLSARERPRSEPLSPWAAGLPAGDIARLALVGKAITPRHSTPYLDGPVLVNAAAWAPPEPIPDDWVIGNAPVPLSGPVTWQGDRTAHGEFYAAAPDDNDDPYGGWLTECADTRQVEIVTDEDAVAGCYAFLNSYGCLEPGDTGMTIAEVARDLGYPLTADGAEAADVAARATFVLRASRANGDVAWYAVHGPGRRDWLAAEAARDGWQVTPAGEIPFGDAPQGAREMAALALGRGWDLVYTNEKGGKELMAVNGDTGDNVSRVWDASGHLIRAGDLDKITASPRSLYMRPGGSPAPELLDPVARAFPEEPVTAPRKGGGRPARTGSQAAATRHAGPRP